MREEETLNQDNFHSSAVNPYTGQQMGTRLLGMKEYDRIMEDLRKENCDLKLRIYFLQDGWKEKFGCDSREIQTQMEELKKIIHDKETEIIGKEKLLLQRKTQMKQLINRLEIEQARSKTLQQDVLYLNKQLSENENFISTLKHELNVYKQLKMKNNVADIFMLSHGDDDDSSLSYTSIISHDDGNDSSPSYTSILHHGNDDDDNSSPTDTSIIPHGDGDDLSLTDIFILPHDDDDDSSPTDTLILPRGDSHDSGSTDICILPRVDSDASNYTDISILTHSDGDDSNPADISVLTHGGCDDLGPTDIFMLPHVDGDVSNSTDISILTHSDGDDSSSTETMSSGSKVHLKSFETEPYSKSKQGEQPFNKTVECQTVCSLPTSSYSLQLSLHSEQSSLGGDSISLSEAQCGNSAAEIASSPSDFKDRLSQINSELQELLEVKTKENLQLRSKLGLLDHVKEIDPTFLPDVNQLKKETEDLKIELEKSTEIIQKQQISINVQHKEIKRMRRERNACLCGLFGHSGEWISNVLDNKNFDNQHHHRHHWRRKSRNKESLPKNQTVQNADDTTDFDPQVKHLRGMFIGTDLHVSQQSNNLSSLMNFVPNIYGGHKFILDSEMGPNIQCQNVLLAENSDLPNSEIVEPKNQYQRDLDINNSLQSELAICKVEQQQKQEQQQQMSTTLNKDNSSSHLASGLSPILALQLLSFSKKTTRTKYLLNTFSRLSLWLHPSANSGLDDNISEVTMLLKQEALMYALSYLPIW